MISLNDSSLYSLLLRKTILDPQSILKTYHKNCMYTTDKTYHEVSTQSQSSLIPSIDEQIQVSQLNESKESQTCYLYSPITMKNLKSKSPKFFINPYSIIDRVNQGETFLKFLSKQNTKLDLIYTNFIKNLQKYTDHFLLSLQQEHSLYGIYRKDLIRYMIILQEYINDLRIKLNIFQEGNKNFHLFQKHYHNISENKYQLEDCLNKYEKYFKQFLLQKRSDVGKYQEKFFEIYQTSTIQLRAIEQQRLLAIREQMKFAINLTIFPISTEKKKDHIFNSDEQNLFISTNFDELINNWEQQNRVSLDHWLHFPHRLNKSQHDNSLVLFEEIKQVLDEYYNHRQITPKNKYMTLNRISDQLKTIDQSNEEFLKRIDSITSNLTHSHI